MTGSTTSTYTSEQIAAWLRGLLSVAWADGDFAEPEKALISELTKTELAPQTGSGEFEPISPEELAKHLGHDKHVAENFMRTAVMVAVADGVYTSDEAELLQTFCQALGLEIEALKSLEHTLYETESGTPRAAIAADSEPHDSPHPHSDLLHPVRHWLDDMEVHDPRVARFICKLIPSQCPFERDVELFGHKVVHIPPLCKLNPLYEQLVGLRFRALSYLADECQEDVSPYV